MIFVSAARAHSNIVSPLKIVYIAPQPPIRSDRARVSVAPSIPSYSNPPSNIEPRKIAFGGKKKEKALDPAWVASQTTEGILRRQPLPPSPSLSPKPSIVSLTARAGSSTADAHLDCPHRPDSYSPSSSSSTFSDDLDLPDPAMDYTAPLSDLHLAAAYISGLLRDYVDAEAGFARGSGIPHAFAGSWEVRALSEGLGGASEGAGDGYEEIICLTPASNRHLRLAFHAHPHHCLSPSLSTSSYSSSFSYGTDHLASPTDSTYFTHPQHMVHYTHPRENHYTHTESDDGGKSLELHCHPKSGVPMTVIVNLGEEGTSGKKIRIDMLQAGEYGPRKLYAPTPAGNAPLWEIMGLPFLSPTEFVRAKLRCNREYWDLGDISWMMINYAEQLDLNRLSIEEVEEFVERQQDPQTTEVWERLKDNWGV